MVLQEVRNFSRGPWQPVVERAIKRRWKSGGVLRDTKERGRGRGRTGLHSGEEEGAGFAAGEEKWKGECDYEKDLIFYDRFKVKAIFIIVSLAKSLWYESRNWGGWKGINKYIDFDDEDEDKKEKLNPDKVLFLKDKKQEQEDEKKLMENSESSEDEK